VIARVRGCDAAGRKDLRPLLQFLQRDVHDAARRPRYSEVDAQSAGKPWENRSRRSVCLTGKIQHMGGHVEVTALANGFDICDPLQMTFKLSRSPMVTRPLMCNIDVPHQRLAPSARRCAVSTVHHRRRPGRAKCGIAVVQSTWRWSVARCKDRRFSDDIRGADEVYHPERLVVGGGTGSKAVMHGCETPY